MFGFILLVFVFVIITMMKQKGAGISKSTFDVFQISGSSFTVFTGVPVTYDMSDIEKIIFSVQRGRRNTSYTGIMRIVKANGKKSRPFLFDSSVYKKKLVLSSSKQEIEEAIKYLMSKLKAHSIPCLHL